MPIPQYSRTFYCDTTITPSHRAGSLSIPITLVWYSFTESNRAPRFVRTVLTHSAKRALNWRHIGKSNPVHKVDSQVPRPIGLCAILFGFRRRTRTYMSHVNSVLLYQISQSELKSILVVLLGNAPRMPCGSVLQTEHDLYVSIEPSK